MAFFLHVSSDMTAGDLVVGAGTLALALFTAWLAWRTSAEVKVGEEQVRLARESIEAQETARRQARREDAAVALSRAMLEASERVKTGVIARKRARRGLDEAHQTLREQWGIASAFLRQTTSIYTAVAVLDNILHTARVDCETAPDEEQDFYPIGPAFNDLQEALAAFVNGEQASEPAMPTPERLIQLEHPDGGSPGLEGVRLYLGEIGETRRASSHAGSQGR